MFDRCVMVTSFVLFFIRRDGGGVCRFFEGVYREFVFWGDMNV